MNHPFPTKRQDVTGSGLISVATKNSVTGNGILGTEVELVNDQLSPGNSYYYGTDGTGTKGFFILPTGGGGLPPIFQVAYGSTTSVNFPLDIEVGLTGSGGATVNLTGTFIVGDIVIISDAGANAGINNILIDALTGNKIIGVNAAQTYTILSNGEVVYLRVIDVTAGVTTWKIQ